MTNPVINHRDPVALFNRAMEPVVQQIHMANLAMLGWLTHELDVLPVELGNTKGMGNIYRKIDFKPRGSYGKGICTASTGGGVSNDNGTGNIFYPDVAFEARPDEVEVSLEEWRELQTWLIARYPTGDVILYGDYIAVRFNHGNGITTF